MTPVALFAAAFIVRLVVGLLYDGPAYPDSYYYVNVARELAAGEGFQVDYIWNFVDVGGRLPADPMLPIPSNAHWMPLASLVQVPFIWLLGATPLAFGLPFWLVGAAAAPLTWAIGRSAGLPGRICFAAGLMVAVPGGMTPFLSQPDNFGLFMTLGALALWLCARAMHGDRRAFVLGGLVVGLATLARADGVLLAAPFVLAAAADLRRRRVDGRLGWAALGGGAALFVLVVSVWLLRQLDVFGTISPPAASGRILWISDYNQLHSISGEPPSPSTLLGAGLGPLVVSRIGGLLAAVGLFALLPLVVVLAPVALIGAWQRRGDRWFQPFFVYAGLLFAVSGLLFAVHVPHGTFIHSASALLPHTFLLVGVGISAAAGWAARRRPSWNGQQATSVFVVGAVGICILGGALQTARATARWTEARDQRRQLVPALNDAPPGELVMSADPGAYRDIAGRGGIVTPYDPLPVIEGALRAYQIRWLALERDQIVPALAPILLGTQRPAWLSAPVARVVDSVGRVRAALFAVCLTPTDARCAP